MTSLRSFASSAVPTSTSTTSTCNVPAGTANGDLLLMFTSNTGPGGYNNPTGWTLIQTQTADGFGDIEGVCWYRIAASEPASYTISITTAATTIMTAIACYTGGINATTPLRTSGVIASGGSAVSTSPTPTALTGVGSTDTVALFYAYGADSSSGTPTLTYPTTSGWTKRIDVGAHISSHFATNIGVCDKVNGTDRPTASASAVGGWAVYDIAIANTAPTISTDQFMPFFGM